MCPNVRPIRSEISHYSTYRPRNGTSKKKRNKRLMKRASMDDTIHQNQNDILKVPEIIIEKETFDQNKSSKPESVES